MSKLKKISAGDVNRLIVKQFGNKLHNIKIALPDAEYILPSEDKVKQVLRDTTIDHRNYQTEVFDCDDFAFLLSAKFINEGVKDKNPRSYLFGRLWGLIDINGRNVMHAVNWYANKNKKIKVIEPQQDKFIPMRNIKKVHYIFAP